MNIFFLHLSDMHIRNERDISDNHLRKIVDSLKSYKIFIKNIVLVFSGDLVYSGEKTQFDNAAKIVGTLLEYFGKAFRGCHCYVLPVPGNHDVLHGDKALSIDTIKKSEYSSVETSEFNKLKHFYNFARRNHCFEDNNMYYCKKILDIGGFRIQANLINNAIYSTVDEYKGLLYIPNDKIDEIMDSPKSDFVITIMHHAPDFYRDEIKNSVEEKIVSNSSILFYGHEHVNGYRCVSYNGSNSVVVQSGGCLSNNGDWSNSSYRLGILDSETKTYSYHKFRWNKISNQYEHNDIATKLIANESVYTFPVLKEFKELLYDEDYKKDYYIFPTVLLRSQKPENSKRFDAFDGFLSELLQYQKIMITGTGNIGKSILLKKLFEAFGKDHIVLFCSPDMILSKSKNKQQNIDKLIKELFRDTFGENESYWQHFEQSDKNKCIFIFDDFDQTEGIDIIEFMKKLNTRFGIIIVSSSQTIDFDPSSMVVNNDDIIAKFEIKPPMSDKRKQLIEAVVKRKADDKTITSISNIVNQIDQHLKSQIKIIPPEPYFIIQCAESYINNIGEAVNSSTNIFSKVFEADITENIYTAIKKMKKNITVDLMFVLIGRIAYYIHFNKSYPISRRIIDGIIQEYNDVYGNILVTQDIIDIAKKAKILIISDGNSESFRFRNKSLLAYFVAKEIISKYRETKDSSDIEDIINKSCINICTDILLFVIFQTDDISILKNIIDFIELTVNEGNGWAEFDIPNNIPEFLLNFHAEDGDKKTIDTKKESRELARNEEEAEETILADFKIKDVYDWDDAVIEQFNNKLIRMTSLLHIISKSLPCFEHKLKKNDKMQLVEHLYRLPNRIFMFWANTIEEKYDDLINELKLLPYLSSRKFKKLSAKQLDSKTRSLFAVYSINLLLNLYFIPAINASSSNTYNYLANEDIFDYSLSPTYKLQNLMFLEQNTSDNGFVKGAIKLDDECKDYISSLMLRWIVRHGIITRGDVREDVQRLTQKFFLPKAQTPFLVERAKNKLLKGQ